MADDKLNTPSPDITNYDDEENEPYELTGVRKPDAEQITDDIDYLDAIADYADFEEVYELTELEDFNHYDEYEEFYNENTDKIFGPDEIELPEPPDTMIPPPDTIAAIATPRGVGGIAVIRISGAEAIAVANQIFTPSADMFICDAMHSHSYFGTFSEPGTYSVAYDTGFATVFYAPRSYTGEDVVELTCHGGILVTNKVLQFAIECGARLAEPGEFTRRALVNGKYTLTDVEAIGELLTAKTPAQLEMSGGDAMSNMSRAAEELRSQLLTLIATADAELDFPEEELEQIGDVEFFERCCKINSRLEAIMATYKTGLAVTTGIKTVICGRPNAGKSTLYNTFTGEQSAIVTEIAGTTRDVLTTEVTAGRVLLQLSDTAGVRDTGDEIERIGVGRARERINSAELLLIVCDANFPISDEDRALMHSPAPHKYVVINKVDSSDEDIIAEYTAASDEAGIESTETELLCDDTFASGFDDITNFIERTFTDGKINLARDPVIMNERQKKEIEAALEAMRCACKALDEAMPVDIVTEELKRAYSALSRLTGKEVGDEVIAEIFSKFCVGK